MSPEKRELPRPSPTPVARPATRDSHTNEARGTKPTPVATPAPRGEAPVRATVSPEERRKRIAECAYYKALTRGFGGGEVERDWLEAEREIDDELLKDRTSKT